ncbi:MAG: twin-arginine translocation protein TatA/E family subunit [Frankiales bacterium]|nr:twin-arginine translocation protein TatA/E family subunit [Frankiales bacterium]
MLGLGTTELIIVAVVIMVLFGAKRLPDSARALGRSMRILKAETKGLHNDDDVATPLAPSVTPPGPRFDPQTGQPVGQRFDPQTGLPLDAQQQPGRQP